MEKKKSNLRQEKMTTISEREPSYGSTIIVWIRPKPGKFCEFNFTIGDAKMSIMIPSSFLLELQDAINLIADKIKSKSG